MMMMCFGTPSTVDLRSKLLWVMLGVLGVGSSADLVLMVSTASSVEETPRGMDFLFSLNRINVAVSRAKGLALVFGAPRLREAKCETVEQMRLVNTLCALPILKQNERGSA